MDAKDRRRLYGLANRSIRTVVPFHLRANITNEQLDELKKRNWDRCIAAFAMERLLIEIYNGIIDREKIDMVLNEWRDTL